MDKRSQSQHNVLPGLNQFPDLEIEHAGIRLLISVPLFVWFAAQSYLFFDFSLTKVPPCPRWPCGYILISAALLVRIITLTGSIQAATTVWDTRRHRLNLSATAFFR